MRPVAAGAVAIMLTLYAIARPLISGAGVPGHAWSNSLGEALSAWPWVWLSPLLAVTGFGWQSATYAVAWALGPVLLGIAVWRAHGERDRRDLALVIGLVAAAIACLVIAPFSAATAREFIEATWLYATPLLALVVVHTVGALRASTTDSVQQRSLKAAPLLAAALFGVLSIAATTTTAVRSVHAPDVQHARAARQHERWPRPARSRRPLA